MAKYITIIKQNKIKTICIYLLFQFHYNFIHILMNRGIGFKIKRHREQKSISQEDLAHQLDVSQSYLSKIKSGTIEKLDFLFMKKTSDFFKVEPQYFLDDQIVQNNSDNKIYFLSNSFNTNREYCNRILFIPLSISSFL